MMCSEKKLLLCSVKQWSTEEQIQAKVDGAFDSVKAEKLQIKIL